MPSTEPRFPHSPDIELRDIIPAQPPDADDDDIYRGEPPFPKDDASSVATSSSGSSSSSSERLGGPLGAITAVVELAISRWARGVRRGRSASSVSTSSSSTSSSSSSSTSRSSVNTLARMRRRLRRKRSASQSSLQTMQSERDIVARISRLKALEESRQVARHFALYLPSTMAFPERDLSTVSEHKDDRVLSSESLSPILSQLESVTKRSRRPRGRSRGPHNVLDPSRPARRRRHPDGLVGQIHPGSCFDPCKKSKKGKSRQSPAVSSSSNTPVASKSRLMPKAWFLDVASPTWADLKELGKLLHLHPLTLEDILQQDPREKLEVFPKLGYYFISFRAIESQAERAKILKEHQEQDNEIPVGEANVYLVVFNEGICCFHNRDISDHTDRVRTRINLLDDVVNMSSDWIAHGILDSIVDAFFPVLNEIEKEVMNIDRLVYIDEEEEDSASTLNGQEQSSNTSLSTVKADSDADLNKSKPTPSPDEKSTLERANTLDDNLSIRPHFKPPPPTLRLLFRHARRSVARVWNRLWEKKPEVRVNPRTRTLRRMAKTRKLVTLLGRLLASKADVVTQIRKRLLQQSGHASLGNGGTKGEELEVAIYMGDITFLPSNNR
ncbi:hypothetical protein MD484_g193, partial [Candolleomyces efflorescens]